MLVNDISRQQFSKIVSRGFQDRMTLAVRGLVLSAGGQSRREDACADRSTRQYVFDGKMHEMNVLDILPPEPRSFAIMDSGFLDFTRLYRFTRACTCFVIRPIHNMPSNAFILTRPARRRVSAAIGRSSSPGVKSPSQYPGHSRRAGFHDEENDNRLAFLTTNYELLALPVARLY